MDFTTFTFFVTNMALLAAGLFLWLERDNVNPKWKTALTVSGMVCFIAAVHYYYMRGNMDATDVVSIRYIDWLITVPLQMVEFYIVLAAVTAVSSGVLNRLLGYSILMLVGGYLGETGAVAFVSPAVGFAVGMIFWGLLLKEIWSGEAAEVNAKGNAAGQFAFDGMKKIVTFGWAIYPLGYFLGYFTAGGVDMDLTNQVYNLADFVNKILIGMIVYAAAKMDTK
tara:strand:- start:595 stop:1266 length:672 start_codon:yes stop_codon:yes gene_type:complete